MRREKKKTTSEEAEGVGIAASGFTLKRQKVGMIAVVYLDV